MIFAMPMMRTVAYAKNTSFQGRWGQCVVIADASCKSCEAITSQHRRLPSSSHLYEYRTRWDPHETPEGTAPPRVSARIVLDGVEEVRHIKTPDHPLYFLHSRSGVSRPC